MYDVEVLKSRLEDAYKSDWRKQAQAARKGYMWSLTGGTSTKGTGYTSGRLMSSCGSLNTARSFKPGEATDDMTTGKSPSFPFIKPVLAFMLWVVLDWLH